MADRSAYDGIRPQNVKGLPAELWARIVLHQIPAEERRKFLLVSSSFRDLVLPVLFSNVTVCFGLWLSETSDRIVTGEDAELKAALMTDEEVAEMTRLNVQACDILRHISRTPSFAKVIKKFSVRAYFVHHESGVFELGESPFIFFTHICGLCSCLSSRVERRNIGHAESQVIPIRGSLPNSERRCVGRTCAVIR